MKLKSLNIFKQVAPSISSPSRNGDNNDVTENLHKQSEDNKVLRKDTDKHKVEELVRKSNRKITSISSVVPWSLFPNTIEVEESRVTFIFRQFFAFQSHSVDIRDITNVFIESGFLFAKLQVVSRTFIQNDIKIDFLKKKEALQVKKIIEGLRTFAYNDIDTSNYKIGDLITKLDELHKD